MGQLPFYKTCDRLRQTEKGEKLWSVMMERKFEISEERFLNSVNLNKLLDDCETWASYKRGLSDEVKFYKSVSNIVFFQTCGFEFIFLPYAEIMKLNFNKTLFTKYPQIDPNEPMVYTGFYIWLKGGRPDRFSYAFHTYLNQRGFSRTNNIIDSEQLERHEHVFNHYWSNYFALKELEE